MVGRSAHCDDAGSPRDRDLNREAAYASRRTDDEYGVAIARLDRVDAHQRGDARKWDRGCGWRLETGRKRCERHRVCDHILGVRAAAHEHLAVPAEDLVALLEIVYVGAH